MAKAKEYKVSKSMIEAAVEMTGWSGDELYDLLGQKLVAQRSLRMPKKFERTPGVKRMMYKKRRVFTFDPNYLRETGKAYFEKFREKLFQKICIEGQACKWEKGILEDTEKLLEKLLPLVFPALGLDKAFIAIAIVVAAILIKWGIRIFCKCPPTVA